MLLDYKVSPKVEKYLKKIKDKELLKKFKIAIDIIRTNPYKGIPKKQDLKNIYAYDLYHNKSNYEIAYKIMESENLILIILVGIRENFYEELKNYLK